MLTTRFTERFGVEHPIVLAPMDRISGGRLAGAVSAAGGFGLIGGGYGDAEVVEQAFAEAGNQKVGVGFITWSAQRNPDTVAVALAHEPAALMVSFGDAEDLVAEAKARDIPTFWQVQTLAQVRQALAARVDVIVVQGQEAGGHGMDRGLTALLPAARDVAGPDQILLAAGGIADGRGLAAAMMLGADGVLMGTRFWASEEANGPDAAKAAISGAEGDRTLRSKVFDLARDADWPWKYTGRVVGNAFSDRWHGDIDGLKDDIHAQRAAYDASDEEDFSTRVVIAGEAVDLIDRVQPAAEIVIETVEGAARLLRSAGGYLKT
ncbi:MAG: nitronate monooxygenase [Pseudomonadota bacterium]